MIADLSDARVTPNVGNATGNQMRNLIELVKLNERFGIKRSGARKALVLAENVSSDYHNQHTVNGDADDSDGEE